MPEYLALIVTLKVTEISFFPIHTQTVIFQKLNFPSEKYIFFKDTLKTNFLDMKLIVTFHRLSQVSSLNLEG